jgi:UDP-N-acetylmuramoylalanine--D-glutamate ligase
MAMRWSVAGQTTVVMGAGRSGIGAAELLAARGASVTLADQSTRRPAEADRLEAQGIRLALGPHTDALFTGASLVVLSPGVSPSEPAVARARARGVPVVGEIELASRWIEGRIVAITGTKGKSTTTTLTARMLAQAGLRMTAGGNLGTALSSQVDQTSPDTIHVVEVSSFQLETIDTFRPWVAVFLNLSTDHLDRHASFEEYASAKARVFENQTGDDWAVINADDPIVLELARASRARRLTFGFGPSDRDGVTVAGDHIVERRAGEARPLVPLAAVSLPGRHLLADVMAAAAVGVVAGVSPSAMTEAVRAFHGLEHALERVGEIAGVRFVNDSKATNVISALRAIESFDAGVVPILGGRYKGGEFADLAGALAARARAAVVYGEAAGRIAQAIDGVVPIIRAGAMADAVARAFEAARPDGVVVLAPGCSSFDMFSDYRARGQAFKDAVSALAAQRAGAPDGARDVTGG